MPLGTVSYEDIYGVGSLDTVPSTQKKTNPNDPEMTGNVSKSKSSIFNLQGNILGQPITVFIGLFGLLVGLKYFVEMKG